MASIIIDISATLLNQTAVNFLIRDTVQAFRGESAAYQFVGEVFDSPTLTEGQRARLLNKFSLPSTKLASRLPPLLSHEGQFFISTLSTLSLAT